jgi:hypothetical protein
VTKPWTRESLYGPIMTEWKPGDTTQHSGIYRVRHGRAHTYPGSRLIVEHQVICQEGKAFPLCNHCGDQPRFTLAEGGEPIEENDYFR